MMFDKVIAAVDKKLERFDPIWQAENGVGGQRDRYYDKTGVAKWREWRGVKDTMVDYGAWLKNLASMAMMVASAPIPCLKGFWEYRWMGSYLGTFMFIDRLFEGFRGYELVTAHKCMHAIVRSLTKKIAFVLSNDRRLGGEPDGQSHLCVHQSRHGFYCPDGDSKACEPHTDKGDKKGRREHRHFDRREHPSARESGA